MEKFVVSYESDMGESEVFGPFNTYEDAVNWMNKDVNEIISSLPSDYSIEHHDETRIEIVDYGYWMVQQLTPAE